jgi:putative spermidine/putrescine transport system ATP-binding protein
MADRIAVFSDGRIQQLGTPEDVYKRPQTRFVADFVGSSNVLPPDFVESLGFGRHYASLRPEAVTLGDGPGRKPFSGRVTAASFLGAANRVTVEANGSRVAAMLPASIAVPAAGETVTLSFLPEDLHTMDGVQ